MKAWLFRFLLGVLFASLMVGLSLAVQAAIPPAQAEPASAVPAQQQGSGPKCETCHDEFKDSWLMGAHARTTSDPAFSQSWEQQGKPRECLTCHTTGYDAETDTYQADSITCEACHGPVPETHPKEPMPVDRAAKSCGNCHTETYFEWQASKHREGNLTCVGCHDPHATNLKSTVGNPEPGLDSSGQSSISVSEPGVMRMVPDKNAEAELCSTCHKQRSANFSHSPHSSKGLTCADCHLGPLTQTGEGHAARDHSFQVRLSTCNACHEYQMHDPVDVHTDNGAAPKSPEPQPVIADVSAMNGVSSEPGTFNPLGFTLLAGLGGLLAGVIVAPRLSRRRRGDGSKDEER